MPHWVNNEVNGSVWGTVVQAGTVNLSAPPPTAMAGLPALDAEFTGRAADLAAVTDALQVSPVTVVSGLAGIGKTTLALKAATEFSGRAVFANLDESAALTLLLIGLGVPQEHIPADQSAREALYRSQLNEQREPMLVFLDNATSAAQVRGFLPGSTRHRVLVTSRHALAELNARLIELDVLPVEEAIALMSAALTTRRPDDPRILTEELAELADRLPLALSIVAAVLADDTSLSVAELASLLRPPIDRLDELEMPDGHRGVRRAFATSYARLAPAEQRLFQLLSLVPAAEISVDHASTLLNQGTRQARRLLNSLRRVHLAENGRTPGRFKIHDLLRLYAAECATTTSTAELESARDRLLIHVTGVTEEANGKLSPVSRNPKFTRFNHAHEAADWLDLEWHLITGMIEQSFERRRPEQVAALMSNLGEYFKLRQGWSEWPRLYDLYLASARQLGDREMEASVIGEIGNYHLARQAPAAAKEHYQAAIEIYRALDHRGAVIGLTSNLASAAWREGDFDTAERSFEFVLGIFAADRRMDHFVGHTLYNLGGIARERGDLDKAHSYQMRASRICAATGNQRGNAMALQEIGNILMFKGHERQALPFFEDARSNAQAAGDIAMQAMATACLGAAHGMLGERDVSRRHHLEAMELYAKIGDSGQVRKIEELFADLDRIQPR